MDRGNPGHFKFVVPPVHEPNLFNKSLSWAVMTDAISGKRKRERRGERGERGRREGGEREEERERGERERERERERV
jgi:hypothetical protein